LGDFIAARTSFRIAFEMDPSRLLPAIGLGMSYLKPLENGEIV